ncbi:unnamed protein product [Gadus morhua 'NCC']
MSALRKVVSYAWCALAVGGGLGLWYIVVPSEERKKEMVKNLPEANPLRAEETRRRNALMMQVLKEAAETDANLARGIGRAGALVVLHPTSSHPVGALLEANQSSKSLDADLHSLATRHK